MVHHPGHTLHALAPGNKPSIPHVFLELKAVRVAVYEFMAVTYLRVFRLGASRVLCIIFDHISADIFGKFPVVQTALRCPRPHRLRPPQR
jgi:hypothetical protein